MGYKRDPAYRILKYINKYAQNWKHTKQIKTQLNMIIHKKAVKNSATFQSDIHPNKGAEYTMSMTATHQ